MVTTDYLNAVKRHIDQWDRRLKNPDPTNKRLAEQAVKDFYLKVQKKEPELILWCQSPYQMAVLPPLVASVLESDVWKQACARLAEYKAGSEEWERAFDREWYKVEQNLSALIDTVINRPREFAMSGIVKDNCRQRLRKFMVTGLKKQICRPGFIDSDHPSDMLDQFRRIKVDEKFARYYISVQSAVEQMAGLPIAMSVPVDPTVDPRAAQVARQVASATSVFNRAAVALRWGAWDNRLITEFVPAAKTILPAAHDQTVIKAAEQTKHMCADLERLATLQLGWLRRLPPRSQPFQDMFEQIADQWKEDQEYRKSKLDKFVGGVQMGLDGWGKIRKMFTEEFGYRNAATWWFPQCASWLFFAQACRFIKEDFFGKLQDDIDCFALLSHGAMGYVFLPNLCFVCEKPTQMNTNAAGRPHSDTTLQVRTACPAATWSDGFKVYSWRGIPVEADLLEHKNSITVRQINSETNAEMKRILIDIYGEARYLMDAGARVVHADECGTLYSIDDLGSMNEALVMVKVKNSTPEPDGTYKHYFLRVPPTMTRAREAVAWTFGMTEEEYCPNFQS